MSSFLERYLALERGERPAYEATVAENANGEVNKYAYLCGHYTALLDEAVSLAGGKDRLRKLAVARAAIHAAREIVDRAERRYDDMLEETGP